MSRRRGEISIDDGTEHLEVKIKYIIILNVQCTA